MNRRTVRLPEGPPLPLCDGMAWLTAGALLTLNPWTFEATFLLGIGGAHVQPDIRDQLHVSCRKPLGAILLDWSGPLPEVSALSWATISDMPIAALLPFLLFQTIDRPVRSVTDPGVVTTRQAIAPAGVPTVFQGRTYGVAFGANAAELWVLNATRI